VIIAAVHVYLVAGHLSHLIVGDIPSKILLVVQTAFCEMGPALSASVHQRRPDGLAAEKPLSRKVPHEEVAWWGS
jgi:hypothetical protein